MSQSLFSSWKVQDSNQNSRFYFIIKYSLPLARACFGPSFFPHIMPECEKEGIDRQEKMRWQKKSYLKLNHHKLFYTL